MTFRHVVAFSWKDGVTGEQIERFEQLLAGLADSIPGIRRLIFGRDAGAAEGNFDFALIGDFDDVAGWCAYQTHPEHRAVLEYVTPLVGQRVAVQFETDD